MAFDNLKQALLDQDEELTVQLVNEELAKGSAARDLFDALSEAMTEVGEKFANMEFFLPEVMLASDAMKAASDILIPEMAKTNSQAESLGTVVIGTVQGDVHTVGKDMVVGTLATGGFEVIDLGKDVAPEVFIEAAEKNNASIIALSALMTATMPSQGDVINFLNSKGIRDKYKVLVGGGVVHQDFADKIGADGYAKDAIDAVVEAKRIIGK
ncbi:corrinoid protein [Dehalobacterium formicoaceticum]|uniref:Corrinoid protein n=1 Tax=Dehalobacterium formicoaceticum TaxID=51515 RepID=A0ABT1Y187_9FIRM|nr:corrinoid protein [Dehalobacterium formicoaceticum]MCR6544623.1 corrinoid protein [Dehalobacterium formicoaceticum]